MKMTMTGDKELKELTRKLKTMGENKAVLGFKNAYSRGLTILARAYRQGSPEDFERKSGRAKRKETHRPMKRSVFRRSRFKNTKRKTASAKVGFNVGQKKKSGRRAFHAHLPMMGTKNRWTKSGNFTGRVQRTVRQAQTRMRSSINPATRQALNEIDSILLDHIRKEFQS